MQLYFLCTGNSCRSQIAEGFAKQYLPSDWLIQSAGIETHGLNPNAVQTMQEIGIDISQQTSNLIDMDYLNSSDIIITLCGDAKDKCPMTPPNIKRLHWDLLDPAQVTGTPEQITEAFKNTRDTIKELVKSLQP